MSTMNSTALRILPSAARATAARASLPRTSELRRFRGFATTTPATASASRTVIITGSSRGIGKSIALRLAHDGYDVCVNDLPALKEGAEETAAEIRAATGRKACVALADVTVLEQVQEMVQKSVKELGPLNTMIANAGICHVKPLLDVTPAEFERIYRINVFGVQNCLSIASKQLIAQNNCTPSSPGKLLVAASVAAFRPTVLLSPYTSTKFAVRGLMQGYAKEMARYNITANAYAPGIVGTDMWDMIDRDVGKETGVGEGETFSKAGREEIALGRTSVPEDVSGLVSFLAGRDSDYITGQTQVVDGGMWYS